jgi:PAS domain S-box-containing protein
MEQLTVIPGGTTFVTPFLDGGGEMGELIRLYDWSKTPLGVPQSWPQSLKTCVRIMLTSRQPMWIGWGKELIKLYNDPYKAIVGGKHPWALGKPASEVWKDIWPDIEPMLKKVMEKDEGTYVESQLLIMERNGYPEETYYTFSYTPIPGDKGGTAGMICANTDDTQKIIGERQLRTLKDLGESVTRMQTVTEVYQKALKVIEHNSKDFPFAVLYKIDDEGKKGLPVAYAGLDENQTIFPSFIDLVNPQEGMFNFYKAFSQKEIVISENKGRRKNLPKGPWQIEPTHFVHVPIIISGGTIPNAILSSALNPYRIFNDTYRQFIMLLADQIALEVNNVMAYEQERKRAEALAEIDKAKTVFFSNISHEFRTPLTLMLGPLEELMTKSHTHLRDDEKLKIETTHRNAVRLLRLVNNLLDFSRIESGGVKAQYQLTDISKFTADLASSFRSVIEGAGLHFEVNCTPVSQPVYVDRSMWEKIILNLLSNAFKYTLKGTISVTLTSKKDFIELIVADTGVGIPGEELPKMFQRFHRVQNVTGRSYEGTGIGLSLINELVKLHNGTISISSKLTKGSQFTITIPSGKSHLPADQITESKNDSAGSVTNLFIDEAQALNKPVNQKSNLHTNAANTPAILIVDDNADMREYLSDILSSYYRIAMAKDGSDALGLLKKIKPDLILSDVMMPDIDGLQLLKLLKENEQYKTIPVILLSARAGEESRIEGYESGADDYLIKPFSSKELLTRVASQINTRKRLEESEAVLRKTKELLELTFSNIPAGVFLINKDAEIIFANNNAAIMSGFASAEEMIKAKTPDLVIARINETYEMFDENGNSIAMDATPAARTLQTGKAHEAPIRIKRKKDNSYYWVLAKASPLFNSNGEFSMVLAVSTDITVQKNAEDELRQSEEKFRTLATEFPLFVWTTDENLQTTFLNKTGLEYFGLSEKIKFKDLSWKGFIHPEDFDGLLATMRTAIEKRESYALKIRLKNGNTGEYSWFLDKGKPRYSNDKFIGFIGTSLDIHQQKLADEKYQQLYESLEQQVLQRTEELSEKNIQLNEAQQIAQLGSWEWNIDTNEVSWSDQMYHIYGYDEERFPVSFEKAIERMIPEDAKMTGKRMEQNIADALRLFKENGSKVFINSPFEYGIVLPNGSQKILRGAGKIILNQKGKVEKIIGTVQDITEHKQSEKRILEANQKLEQRNYFVEKLINSSLDLIMVVDKELKLITINKKAESVIGSYYQGELLSKKITDINPSVKDTQAFEDILSAFKGEIIIRDKVKSSVSDSYYEHNYIPLTDAEGDIYAVMSISHDITENIKQLEELRKLNESDKMKSDFIKMASHELKTPVTSMKGYTQLLLTALNENEKTFSIPQIKTSLTSIDKQITRLTRLMSELFDLSKIETGQLELNKELFNINELVAEIVQEILYTNSKHRIKILEAHRCKVFGDKDRVGQVLTNFLTNAIKYSPSSELIEVRMKLLKGSISISVKDYGIGIDKKDQEKIFERFYRVHGKEEQTYPGFGIGLFIAKEIILRHGGTIFLESKKGKGSVFTFTLPIAP